MNHGPMSNLLLHPLRRPQRIVRHPAPLRPRQGARPDIVVVLADPTVRVLRLQALEAVGADLVGTRTEEGMLESRRRREPLLGVVFKQGRQELVALGAQGLERGTRPTGVLVDGVVVPLLEVAAAADLAL